MLLRERKHLNLSGGVKIKDTEYSIWFESLKVKKVVLIQEKRVLDSVLN